MAPRDTCSFFFVLLYFYIRGFKQIPYTFAYNVYKMLKEKAVEICSFKNFLTSVFLGSQFWIRRRLLVDSLIEKKVFPFSTLNQILGKAEKKISLGSTPSDVFLEK